MTWWLNSVARFYTVPFEVLNRPVVKNQIQLSLLLLALRVGSLSSMSQVPVYNSYPAAAPVIFLDFDGYTVSGTGNYKPKLVNSLIVNGVISVTSPVVIGYALFDMNGEMLKKGKLSTDEYYFGR